MSLSWLRQWAKKVWGAGRTGRRPVQRRKPATLRLESLEERQLLSGTSMMEVMPTFGHGLSSSLAPTQTIALVSSTSASAGQSVYAMPPATGTATMVPSSSTPAFLAMSSIPGSPSSLSPSTSGSSGANLLNSMGFAALAASQNTPPSGQTGSLPNSSSDGGQPSGFSPSSSNDSSSLFCPPSLPMSSQDADGSTSTRTTNPDGRTSTTTSGQNADGSTWTQTTNSDGTSSTTTSGQNADGSTWTQYQNSNGYSNSSTSGQNGDGSSWSQYQNSNGYSSNTTSGQNGDGSTWTQTTNSDGSTTTTTSGQNGDGSTWTQTTNSDGQGHSSSTTTTSGQNGDGSSWSQFQYSDSSGRSNGYSTTSGQNADGSSWSQTTNSDGSRFNTTSGQNGDGSSWTQTQYTNSHGNTQTTNSTSGTNSDGTPWSNTQGGLGSPTSWIKAGAQDSRLFGDSAPPVQTSQPGSQTTTSGQTTPITVSQQTGVRQYGDLAQQEQQVQQQITQQKLQAELGAYTQQLDQNPSSWRNVPMGTGGSPWINSNAGTAALFGDSPAQSSSGSSGQSAPAADPLQQLASQLGVPLSGIYGNDVAAVMSAAQAQGITANTVDGALQELNLRQAALNPNAPTPQGLDGNQQAAFNNLRATGDANRTFIPPATEPSQGGTGTMSNTPSPSTNANQSPWDILPGIGQGVAQGLGNLIGGAANLGLSTLLGTAASVSAAIPGLSPQDQAWTNQFAQNQFAQGLAPLVNAGQSALQNPAGAMQGFLSNVHQFGTDLGTKIGSGDYQGGGQMIGNGIVQTGAAVDGAAGLLKAAGGFGTLGEMANSFGDTATGATTTAENAANGAMLKGHLSMDGGAAAGTAGDLSNSGLGTPNQSNPPELTTGSTGSSPAGDPLGATTDASGTGALPDPSGTIHVTFRQDTRSPAEIIAAGGYLPRVPGSNVTLEDYILNSTRSNYVGTTESLMRAEDTVSSSTGYVALVRVDQGVNVNGQMADFTAPNGVKGNPLASEKEWALPGGAPLENVIGWYPRSPTTGQIQMDQFIPNLAYRPPAPGH